MESRSVKNVVLILTDQQPYRSLGCTGSEVARTPNLDALARRGVNFRNHIVTNTVCMPSRASIHTGQYINQHGVWRNGCRLSPDMETIPMVLGRAGVDCAHFGKLHLEPIINRVGPAHDYGYPTCEISEGDQQLTTDAHFSWLRTRHPAKFLDYINEMYQNGHARGYCSKLPEDLHMTHFVTDQAIDWLRAGRERDKPFFLSVGYFDPHHAFNPVEPYHGMFKDVPVPDPVFREGDIENKPEQYRRAFKTKAAATRDPETMTSVIRAFHAMMAHIDHNVGRLVRTLREQGLGEDTLVLFSSDHGEMLGNHGLLHKGAFLLDDLIRVPMIAGIPDGPERNDVCDEPTSGVDFLATLARLFGADTPAGPGMPMLGAEGNILPDGARGYALCEWEGGQSGLDLSLRCIRTRDHKLITYGDDSVGELYDLKADPDELTNLYGKPGGLSLENALRAILTTCYQDTRPSTVAACPW